MRALRESVTLSAIVLALLTGCAATEAPGTTIAVGDVDFTGPWAKEFSDAYRKATSPFVKAALRDGKISDQEFAEMEQKFRSCLADASVGFDGFGPGGSYSTENLNGISTSENQAATDRCTDESGQYPIGTFYYWVKSNPRNLDGPTIIAACFVKKKVVPPGYSAKDYTRDSQNDSFPFSTHDGEGAKVMQECSYDPLGLMNAD
ncbi:hypothetical protein [Leifsonia sp. C5G2]|uniref:hypothetical protein n=1 Tax=Leifsonia sp. C5G2 TaxID=2735269 RepID=UPI0015855096|nr:hypothetical protein [Leifsonia sp. C5G2]NUU05331.1 hypothetical protein [Leifsonia sp. C5G2]